MGGSVRNNGPNEGHEPSDALWIDDRRFPVGETVKDVPDEILDRAEKDETHKLVIKRDAAPSGSTTGKKE